MKVYSDTLTREDLYRALPKTDAERERLNEESFLYGTQTEVPA